jgi:hypothetical protein
MLIETSAFFKINPSLYSNGDYQKCGNPGGHFMGSLNASEAFLSLAKKSPCAQPVAAGTM